MGRVTTTTGIALLVFAGLTAGAAGQAVEGTVSVLQGRARFAHAKRSGDPRHTVRLTLLVGPRSLPDFHVPEQQPLRVTVGGTLLLDADPGADGYHRSKGGRWRYRGVLAGSHVALSANPLTGRIKVKVARGAFTALEASDAVDLPVTLKMAGTSLETTASFAVRSGHVRRWTGLAREIVPGPGPGPGPDPDPGALPVDVAFSLLREGLDTRILPRQNTTARSDAEWSTIWSSHQPGTTPPAVDFGRDMVVGVFLAIPKKTSQAGWASTVRVVSVNDTSSRREVVWEEVADGAVWTCPPPGVGAPCFLPAPYQFVLAPRTSLPVVFRER